MIVVKQWRNLKGVYADYPRQFWLLMLGAFIDRLGGALVFPFFALYITAKFDVGMTQVGIVFAIFSVFGIMGSFIGGALSDKLGRKGMVILGLVTSALSSLAFAFVDDINLLYGIAIFVGTFSNMGGPASMAMIADLLPEEQHAEGYSMFRVIINLAITIGPMIGGLIASRSFVVLFIADAITSIVMATMIAHFLTETRPEDDEDTVKETFGQTFKGYGKVLRDYGFATFLLVSILVQLVYIQMYSTMPVYLRDIHDIPAQGYGYILSMNAGMVVIFQFWFTRRTRGYAPLIMMALGSFFYMIGFGIYGVVTVFGLFALGMILITIGEMIVMPVAQALVAQLSPADMRGRYMAMFGFSWAIPSAAGPYLAGLVMDNGNPDAVWYLCAVGGAIGIVGYLTLHRIFTAKDRVTTIEEAEALEQATPDAPDGAIPATA